MPPAVAVNHETRECAEIFTGDECMDCAPAAGWEIVGVVGDVPHGQCPEGYTLLDDLDVTCTPFQNEFCCSEGHSGAPGDCTNLVVHERNEECAFIAGAAACTLPVGWSRPAADPSYGGPVCPAAYRWVDDVACATGAEEVKTAEEEGPSRAGRGLCPGAALVSPLLLAGVVLTRRRPTP